MANGNIKAEKSSTTQAVRRLNLTIFDVMATFKIDRIGTEVDLALMVWFENRQPMPESTPISRMTPDSIPWLSKKVTAASA